MLKRPCWVVFSAELDFLRYTIVRFTMNASSRQKLFYIANVNMPTTRAHGLQIMKMCAAFAEANKNCDVVLVVPRRFNLNKEEPFGFYNVPRTFSIQFVGCIDLIYWDRFFGRCAYFVQVFSFLLHVKIKFLFSKKLIFTRELWTLLFFPGASFEAHTFPNTFTRAHSFLLKRAAHIFTLTSFLKQKIESIGVANSKIFVEADAVNPDEFLVSVRKDELREMFGLPKDAFLVMYTGSFALFDWKGVDTLLEAAKIMNGSVVFVLVGEDVEEIEKIKTDELANRVIFVPHQLHKVIPQYLAAADVLVLPNKNSDVMSSAYTSPLKLFEYMAAQRPIVASDLPSIREVVDENDVWFFEAGNVSALVKVLGDFCGLEQSVVDSKIFSAYKKVLNLTWVKRAERILKIIE